MLDLIPGRSLSDQRVSCPDALHLSYCAAGRAIANCRERVSRVREKSLKQNDPDILCRVGPLEARLARTKSEVRRAQRLRFSVFYEELAAQPDLRTSRTRRDEDEFDAVCDHILVVDHDRGDDDATQQKIVGTCRTLRARVADAHDRYYSAAEFDLAPMLAKHGKMAFCEIGRSCVLPEYRNRRTMETLWTGLWAYAARHNIDVYFGTASLQGTNLHDHRKTLSFLREIAAAPETWQVRAHPNIAREVGHVAIAQEEHKNLFNMLPPLLKGYLRIGAWIGEGAFVDRQFSTTDVMVITLMDRIPARYRRRFHLATGFTDKFKV